MTQAQPGFDGVERLYGADSYKAIRKAHICVVGIVGVGTWVAEALARSGVGQITLIDRKTRESFCNFYKSFKLCRKRN